MVPKKPIALGDLQIIEGKLGLVMTGSIQNILVFS